MTCLDQYAANTFPVGTYPWAVPLNDTALYTSTTNTLFGRIPIKEEITDSLISDMTDAMIDLQMAVNDCKVANNAGNRSALDNAGNTLENFAKDLKDNQPTTPAILPAVTTPAIDAGDKAQDGGRCADILADPNNNSVQTNLNTANTEIISALPNVIWPSCDLFASTRWNHWKELVFFQVADGYKSGSSSPLSCGNCLSVDKNGLAMPGSGTYRATVMVAGGNLVASRTKSNLPDYLEPDNQLPQGNPALPYKTYDITDINYQTTTNDLVLCLNGRTDANCQ